MRTKSKSIAVLFFMLAGFGWSGAAGCVGEPISTVEQAAEPTFTLISENHTQTTDGNGDVNGGIKTLQYEVDDCADLSVIFESVVENNAAVGTDGFVPAATSTNDTYNSPTRTADDVVLKFFVWSAKAGDLSISWGADGATMSGTMTGPSKVASPADPTQDELPTFIANHFQLTQQNPPSPFWSVSASGSYTTSCTPTAGKTLVEFSETYTVTADTVAAMEFIAMSHKANFDFKSVVEEGMKNLEGCDDPSPTAVNATATTGSSSSSSGSGGSCGS